MKLLLHILFYPFITISVYAQSSCASKLASAKSLTMAIARGDGSKRNEEALTTLLVRLSVDCSSEQREYNKWLQNLDDPANLGISGENLPYGKLKTYEEAHGNNNELFKPVQNQKDLILPNNPGLQENRNSVGMGLSGVGISNKALENEKQNEQYKNNAQSQIENVMVGFKPANNEDDLINPTLNLDAVIKNFESKITGLSENLKNAIVAKANVILNTETNPQIAARKLNSLIKEFGLINDIKKTNTIICFEENADKLMVYFKGILKRDEIGWSHGGRSKDCQYYLEIYGNDSSTKIQKAVSILRMSGIAKNVTYSSNTINWY